MSPSSAVGPKERVVAEVVGATDPEGRAFASRSDWLSAAGHLSEEECYVEGIGLLLLSEIDGVTRASIMTEQSAVALSEDKIKKINRQQYEQILLVGGVVDPMSPPEARKPMFSPADAALLMKVGGSKIGRVVDVIERLSLLGQYAPRAEGNSPATQNGAGTSSSQS